MAYKDANFFYAKALAFYGYRTWADLDRLAKKRKWSAETYLKRRAEIERLQTVLHGEYINGATDAINSMK